MRDSGNLQIELETLAGSWASCESNEEEVKSREREREREISGVSSIVQWRWGGVRSEGENYLIGEKGVSDFEEFELNLRRRSSHHVQWPICQSPQQLWCQESNLPPIYYWKTKTSCSCETARVCVVVETKSTRSQLFNESIYNWVF